VSRMQPIWALFVIQQPLLGANTIHTSNTSETHILSFVVGMPDAEGVGLGFNPWVGQMGTWDLSWGRSQSNCTWTTNRGRPCQSACDGGSSTSTMNCRHLQ
jgi:hypothetical protein